MTSELDLYRKWCKAHDGKTPILWWVRPDHIPAVRKCNGEDGRWIYLDTTKDDSHIAQQIFIANRWCGVPTRVRGRPDRAVIEWPNMAARVVVHDEHLDGFLAILQRNGLSGECRKAGTDERRKF